MKILCKYAKKKKLRCIFYLLAFLENTCFVCASMGNGPVEGAITCTVKHRGGAGKARFNVATPTYEARTRPLHVQHTYYRIIFKQNPFNIISRGVQR